MCSIQTHATVQVLIAPSRILVPVKSGRDIAETSDNRLISLNCRNLIKSNSMSS
jgi:hypothetical protein